MKIAMLGHKRVPSREGGVEIVVEELGVRMVEMGHEVTCYNRRGRHVSGPEFDVPARTQYRGMRLKQVPTIDRKGLAAMSASFFASLFVAFSRYDVVHFHAEGPCAMLWLPKLTGKRCIATIHGLDHQRSKWNALARAYIMLGERCAARFADEIIVLSRSTQEYFQKTYGRETRLIPNGVNRPRRQEVREIAEKYGLSARGYLLYLGRIVPEKGVHYLIEAYRQVKTDMPLVIAGGSSDSEEYFDGIRRMARGDERIRFTGFVQGRVLEELYSNAYAYVLPSDLEGMPLSLLEAMSYGNCCVVSDIPECAEVVGEYGVVFPKGNVAELTKTLQELCDDEQKVEQCRQETCRYISGLCSWDTVVEETMKLY